MTKTGATSGIVQTGPQSFRVSVMIARERRSRTVRTLQEAIKLRDDWMAERQAKRLAAKPPPKPAVPSRKPWTLLDLFRYALDKPASDGGWKSARWEPDVRRIAKQWMAYFGSDFPIAAVRRSRMGDNAKTKTIDGFIAECRAGRFTCGRKRKDGRPAAYGPRNNRNGTINRKLDVLKKALKLAVAFRALDAMPVFPPRPRESRTRIRFYSRAEERALLGGLLSGAQHPRSRNVAGWLEAHDQMCVLIDVGLRWGELFSIQAEHFWQQRRELFVPGIEESGQQNDDVDRVMPLTARAFEILSRRCGDADQPFKLSYNGLSYRFDKVKTAMRLTQDKRFTIHTARHTFCSRLAQQGVDAAIIKELAGHKVLATTLRYTHLDTRSRRAAIDAMEASSSAVD